MSPASVRTSRASHALETGEARLWVLLVGVNHYQDQRFPTLSYPARDCQGLGEAIAAATQAFPKTQVQLHHDAVHPSAQPPRSAAIYASLRQIAAAAQPQDTVLFYFSGHGILDAATRQAVLCLSDTHKDDLFNTGLAVPALLALLSRCAAHQQLLWLDACHSEGMTFQTAQGELETLPLASPTASLIELLQDRAAQNEGFYALLACAQEQQSWEFPELGHGIFSYFLMRGLRGEAADEQGGITVDALYKYVYHQTLRYIDKTNQQLRLINQQKRGRGETQVQPEYPLQTPQRIGAGGEELILGIKPAVVPRHPPRQAFVVDGLGGNPVTLSLSKVLRSPGRFELHYFPQPKSGWAGLRTAIETGLQGGDGQMEAALLLYLRGQMVQTEAGEARLLLRDGAGISRSWLRQILRRSTSNQIVILDCPGASDLGEWLEDLQMDRQGSLEKPGQCLIAAASPLTYPEAFTSVLLETLSTADPLVGLSVAGWIAQIQAKLAGSAIVPHIWLSGNRIIEVLPSQMEVNSGEDGFDLGICPYLGLRAFSEADAAFFFGRTALIQQLVGEISQRSFLAVVGAVGSGKSSVVQAGLMAQLRLGSQIPESDQWWIRSLRPGSKPLEALVQSLVDGNTEADRKYQQLQLERLLSQGVEGFVQWLRSCPEPIVVLVVDQFEELYTLSPAADRQQFLDLILGGLKYAEDRFKLVLTLRTDLISTCLGTPDLAAYLQQSSILVPPVLSQEGYRQAILCPAEKVGLAVQPELVEVLLQALSHSPGDLPLLEFILEQLWENRQPGELTLQVYQQQIGELKGSLERKAQAVYDSLDPEAQDCARWIFLSLTQLSEGTEDTGRRILKSDLVVNKYAAALVDRTLQAFTAAKLVVVTTDLLAEPDEELPIAPSTSASFFSVDPSTAPFTTLALPTPPAVTIEVAHEILLRHWSTLRCWLEENRARLRSQRQIEVAARQWQQSGQQPEFLLRDAQLDAAAELYAASPDELSQEAQQLIEAALQERHKAQRHNQQRWRRTQGAIALISLLGLAAAGFGGFAFLQRQRALVGEIRALNALSESQLLSNRSLEALTTAVRASRQLQQVFWLGIGDNTATEVQTQTTATLQQAVEETQERNRFQGHSEPVNSLSISPDGQLIASGSDDATVRIWKPDGSLANSWETPGQVRSLEFSPNGRTVATVSGDTQGETSVMTLWNVADGKAQLALTVPTYLTSVAFSPNGLFVAAGGRDRTIKLWNVRNGNLLRTFTGQQGWVNSIAFSPDGKTLAAASEDKSVKLWNVAKTQLLQTLTRPAPIQSIAFSPDGKTLAAAGSPTPADGNAPLTLWNLSQGSTQTLAGHHTKVNCLRFSPDGQLLLSASADTTLKLWRLSDRALIQTLKGHEGEVLSADFSPQGDTLFSSSSDQTLRSWDIRSLHPPVESAYTLSVSPNHQTFATAGWDGKIRIWNRTPIPTLLKTLDSHTVPVSALSFSPDGNLLASGSDDQTIKIWNPVTGKAIRMLNGHQARVTSLSFSSTGERLASGSDDQTIRIWDPADGRLIQTIAISPDSVSSLAFSPQEDILATGGYSNTIKLWNPDGTLLKTLTGHSLAIAAVTFSPDGHFLASASWDNTIKLWRVSNGSLLRTFSGHQNGVTSLTFSPDGKLLASGGADHVLKLWNPQTGTLIKSLLGQPDPILSLSFTPDGNSLLSASETIGIQQWDLHLQPLLQTGCDRLQNYLQTNLHVEKGDRQLCSPAS
ncbi:MAG TPA: caspase family protein [Coleofasciculaceae cyanobacterium]